MSAMTNILTSNVTIKGSIKFSRDLIVDGRIEGEVTSDTSNLTIGENAYVKGDISVKTIVIFGEVEGTVSVENCQLKSTAKVTGDITSNSLAIEGGATLIGSTRAAAPDGKKK